MKDMQELARKAASSVALVAFDANPWDGMIVFTGDGTPKRAPVVTSYHVTEVKRLVAALNDNLVMHSIPSRDGAFVPIRSLAQWHDLHLGLLSELNLLRDDMVAKSGEWEATARSSARAFAASDWRAAHPGEEYPPPSYLSTAENGVSLSLPSKTDLIGSFRVPVRYNSHPFVFMNSSSLGTVTLDDMVEAAWLAVDGLLAWPYRMLADSMGREKQEGSSECLTHKKLRVSRACHRFLAIELMGDEAIREPIKKVAADLDGQGAVSVDWKETRKILASIEVLSRRLSTVAGIVGGQP